MVKVSVIIPTFNRGHLIKRTLRNVCMQTWKDFEVIVIDDGSTDNTEGILRRECSRNSKIRYIKHGANRGVSAARNTGILQSSGEYIAFLDSDDRWVPAKLEEQMRIFKSSSDKIGLIYTGYVRYEDEGRVQYKFPRLEGYLFPHLLSNGFSFIPCSSVVIPKKVFDDVGLFDEQLIVSEDYDLWLRITKKYEAKFVPQLLVHTYATRRDRLSLKTKRHAMGHLLIFRKFKKEIDQFNLRHRHFFALASILIEGREFKLGRYFLLKAILERPKEIKYVKLLAKSFLIKMEDRFGTRLSTPLRSILNKTKGLFRKNVCFNRLQTS